MIRVSSPSRLHFGLLRFPREDPPADLWPNWEGQPRVPARQFGGVGLMIEEPGVCLSAWLANDWEAEGPLADRALAYARQFARETPEASPFPLHLRIERCAPEHAGLGTGTQLGLAVARALALAWDLPDLAVAELARRVGRGRRSALGIHGFGRGGFLVDGGKGSGPGIAPLVARVDFPEAWRVVLVVPAGERGLHGDGELEAFAQAQDPATVRTRTDALCRLVLLGLLPALIEADLDAFGEALYDFNGRVGTGFAAIQRGVYASPRAAGVINHLRREGVRGVGQSSWGPSVYAVVGDDGEAADLARRLRRRFGLGEGEVLVTGGCNHGALAEIASPDR